MPGLQERIDRLEEKAIGGQEFTEREKQFLRDLYTCLGKGGRLTIAPQTGRMMQHYLSGSGEDLMTASRIYVDSRPVQVQMNLIRQEIVRDLGISKAVRGSYSSTIFYMADPQYFDSVAGLYFGRIRVSPKNLTNGKIQLSWKAESTWQWPSYAFLYKKYGNYHAQCFMLPNAKSKLFGSSKYCLRLDDGLGHYLETLDIARPFLVYSEWTEEFDSKQLTHNKTGD